MKKRTKELMISQTTKQIVYERDKQCCVLCGSAFGQPNAHFIARAQGGLGTEQNIVTLCFRCHREYDHTIERKAIRTVLAEHLKSHYSDWNESNLIFKRWYQE